jgi:hypothetical protein
MNHDEIDRVLSREEEILPSSGFAASVMEAVRREAAAPAPITFPWKRALPGVVLAGLTVALVAVVLVAWMVQLGREGSSPQLSADWISASLPFVKANLTSAAGWTLAVLALSLASVMLSLRLAGGRA